LQRIHRRAQSRPRPLRHAVPVVTLLARPTPPPPAFHMFLQIPHPNSILSLCFIVPALKLSIMPLVLALSWFLSTAFGPRGFIWCSCDRTVLLIYAAALWGRLLTCGGL
jgi:hypothetical protein